MKLDSFFSRRLACVAVMFLPCIVALSGCGTKEMYHVSGKVSYKDGSVPHATLAIVLLAPKGDVAGQIHKGASGSINADGSFDMVTRMPGDGVHRGDYGVYFRVVNDTGKGQVSIIAPKYSMPTAPVYTVTVDRDISDLNYQIEKAEGVSAEAAPAPAGPGTAPAPGT